MGEVWFGYDKRLDRPVAVKFIRTDKLPGGRPDQELIQRFVRESRITARLQHPGVPAVYDCGSDGDDLYMVMQLLDGCPVSSLLDEVEEVPVAWAAAIAAQVCSVLAVAHASSLVHRDLKPSNLMLCPDGTVKVLDFGVAAALSGTETRLTGTGVAVGTPQYMAPEQAESGATSPRSDLYSLGVVLDELLTSENQFAGATALASMRNHADKPPKPLRTRRRDAPEGLERLLLRLLAKEPEKRPSSAAVVYERLLDFCRELPPLPGYVDTSALHPARMYAAVVSRIDAPAPPPADRSVVPAAHPTAEPVRPAAREPARPAARVLPSEADSLVVAVARKDAAALKAESRFVQAAGVLEQAVAPAVRLYGAADRTVIDLRIELADVLFLGGDYRRAAPEFQRLAADVAELEGPGDDLVLRCRLMEANCHAMLGQAGPALELLGRLLDDERSLGVDEDRILELRRQIGLLELGSGRRVEAGRTLGGLLPDLERRYGPGHINAVRVREVLERLDG
ncbi:serine/threonine protein kinase [Planomonospora sp. ID82291]|nr:serine/threonine protein kinase [Planomonospora sp. ID82291]